LVRTSHRLTFLVLAVYPLCVVGLIVFHGWEVYWNNGRLVGLQGRYLFPAVAIYCALFGLAWSAAFRRAGQSIRVASAAILGTVFVAVGVWGIITGFEYRWFEEDASLSDAWAAMAASGAVAAVGALVIALTASIAATTAIICAAMSAGRDPLPDEPSH